MAAVIVILIAVHFPVVTRSQELSQRGRDSGAAQVTGLPSAAHQGPSKRAQPACEGPLMRLLGADALIRFEFIRTLPCPSSCRLADEDPASTWTAYLPSESLLLLADQEYLG